MDFSKIRYQRGNSKKTFKNNIQPYNILKWCLNAEKSERWCNIHSSWHYFSFLSIYSNFLRRIAFLCKVHSMTPSVYLKDCFQSHMMDYNFCLGQKHSVVIGEQLLASNMKLFVDLIIQGWKPTRGHVERRIALRLLYCIGSHFLSQIMLNIRSI